MMTNATQVALDVRPVAPKDRFELNMGTYEALPTGGTMELTLDHDPTCMYFTLLSTKWEGTFDFGYLDQGPIDWRVLVRKHEGSV
jgi:uncharacterized protein (DUF2249 family)